ncbi:MAG: helix-turn-helix transcriptional regulator [Methylotenera sp.]|nr:helix-turn-helix transcriptional regulator [Methylotenera sp.]
MVNINLDQKEIWHSKILEQGLDQLGQALLIVSSRCEILFTSKSAETLLENHNGLSVVNNHLIADLTPDDLRLQKAIQSAIHQHNDHKYSVGLYIHRNQQPKPYYLTVSQMQKQANEKRDGHNALILIKDLELNYERWAERLKTRFSMSPREIECVVLLTERRSVQEVAEVMGICTETVRQYLKSVFKKMDVQKLHELVSLALEYRRNR